MGSGSTARLMPAFCRSGTFHGPVRKYGDSPAMNFSLAMSPVMLEFRTLAPVSPQVHELLGELDAAGVAQDRACEAS